MDKLSQLIILIILLPWRRLRRDSRIGRQLPVLVLSRGIASNRVLLTTDHFSDATDLTALPFDQLPTTFFIALPFLHRPLIVDGDVATSVTPLWARYREREKEKKNEREREKMREKTRAVKETARPRWEDVYTAQQEARSLCPSNRVASRRVGANYSRYTLYRCRDLGE